MQFGAFFELTKSCACVYRVITEYVKVCRDDRYLLFVRLNTDLVLRLS